METTAGQLGTQDFGRRVAVTRTGGRTFFFTGLSLAMFFIVLVGFSRTYYLKSAFGTPELTLLYHVHGAVFTSWMLLMILQPALVATGRTPLHRRLGVVGGVLTAAMVVLGYLVSVDLARRGSAPPGMSALAFMPVALATVVVFPALVGSALWWRQYPATHKRLMLLATMELLPAGVGRWPVLSQGGPLVFFGGADLAIVALLVYDRIATGRFHPATVWGGAFLVTSQVVRVLIGFTETWQAFARWLIA